jgi:hypothetical protein
MAPQFVDDVQVLHPLFVAIHAPDIGVLLALLPNFPLQQAIIDCVLHLGLVAHAKGVFVADKGAGEN